MALLKIEKETVIVFNEDEKVARVTTYNSQFKSTLNKLCNEYPDKFKKIHNNGEGCITYDIPKKNISISTRGLK